MSKAGPTNTATSNGTQSSAASVPASAATTSTSPSLQSQGASASTVRSAWSKGPPTIPAPTSAAGAASANGSSTGTRASSVSGSPQLGASANGTMPGPNGTANGAGNGQAKGDAQPAGKKASLLAIGADGKTGSQAASTAKPMNIARAGQPGSAINFGSIDSPTAQLSSSPAAPNSTGSHLPSGLKSFGSIEAAEGGPAQSVTSPVIGHSRKMSNMSGLVIPPFQGGNKSPAAGEAAQPGKSTPSPQPAAAGTAAPPKKFNPHALFQSNASPSPSMASTSATSPPPVGGIPPNATGQGMYMQQPGRPQMQQALGYDNQGRPLTMGAPGGQPFSPQQIPGMPNHNGQPFPGMNPYPQHQQPGGVPQFRPAPGQPMPNGLAGSRSPNMSHQQPHAFNPQQPQFRPQQQGQQPQGQNGPQQGQRSGGPNSLSPRAQHQQLHPMPGGMQAYGMHPGQMQGFAGSPYQGGYYAYASFPEQQNPYAGMPPQWQAQQARPGYPGAMPVSPRNAPASLSGSSPAPSHSGLPGQPGNSGTPSPALSSSRPTMGGSQVPHALSHQNSGISTTSSQSSVPGTPSQVNARPFQPGAFGHLGGTPGTPGSPMNPSLSAGATAFTPRAKVPLTFKRPDGSTLDIAAAAQSAKASSAAATASAASSDAGATTAPATPAAEAPKPKAAGLPYKPVVVRLETEAQKEARLAEEAKEKKIKEIEQKEEAERKERKAREEAEKAEKAEKEKKEAEEKVEQERLAKEQAEQQAEKDAAAAKEAQEKEAAEAKRKAEEEEQARKKAAEEADAKAKVEAAAKEQSDAEAKSKADAEAASAEEKKAAAPAAVADKAETASAVVSAEPSPAGSPASGSAGLPNRPGSAAKRPLPLDLANSPTPSSPAIASAAALSSAKPIEDIHSITYPSPLQSPAASLNTDASPGKFRYDRAFLLQFMEVCKEKPEALPPFAAIGMEADTSGGFGRGGSRTGQSRGSGGGMPRGGPGLGISNMGSFGGKAGMGGGMGSFGMGNFSSTKGTTSEERAAASARAAAAGIPGRMGSGGPMMRAPSQTGPMGGMGMSSFGRPTSRPGKKRPERAPAPSFANPEPGVAPLEISANRWAPGVQSRRPGAVDENSPEFIERKVKALLNKLTKEKFESISNQILEWANKSSKETDGQTLRLVIKLIFEKAKDEQFWSEMYARLCVKLHQKLSDEVKDTEMVAPDGTPFAGGPLFRKYLLGRCQEDFEKGWKNRDDASAAAKTRADDDAQKKAEHDKAVAGGQQVEEFKFSDEYYAEQTAKRQGLGLVKFVGELFKLGLLSPKIIVACTKQLLRNVVDPDEEDVESLCQLLSTAGKGLDAHSAQSKQTVDIFMSRMAVLAESTTISSRIKFMVETVIELRAHGWVSRNAAANAGPMTIEEVHRAAAQEQAQAARAAAMAPQRGFDNSSRGGSRRGEQRVPHPSQPGQEGWQPAGRPPAKAADLSNFGKIQKSGGPTFAGPSSVFSKKGKAGGDATPPLSRTSSSANMFSALADGGNAEAGPSEASTVVGTPESGPQRKKLVLKPRTTPKEGEDDDADADEVEEEEDAETPAEAAKGGDFEGSSMTKDDVERKIEADLKELWGEKDAAGTRRSEDIVEYFQYLPEGARHMLAKKLVDDVFRIAKVADTEIVVKGFELAVEQDLITPEIVKQSVLPSVELLDDLAVDIPQAYTFAAQLIVAGNLEDSDVAELADKIEDYGGAMIKPKDKLLKAVAKVNGEDAPAAA